MNEMVEIVFNIVTKKVHRFSHQMSRTAQYGKRARGVGKAGHALAVPLGSAVGCNLSVLLRSGWKTTNLQVL